MAGALPVREVRMWVVAGMLLGLVVLLSLLGFHLGPHAHLAAGVVGVLAVVWLVLMAVDGRSDPLLWTLLGTDSALSVGVGLVAWKGLSSRSTDALDQHIVPLESAEGVAVGDLDPNGTVRVHGEDWSAVAVNGTVRAGSVIQVLRVKGVRLEVWGEGAEPEEESLGADVRRLHPFGRHVTSHADRPPPVQRAETAERTEREVP